MSILRPFVYDPLVEWSKPTPKRSKKCDTGEVTNEQARTHIQAIEDRLTGNIYSICIDITFPIQLYTENNTRPLRV